jgi:hypothetical protein
MDLDELKVERKLINGGYRVTGRYGSRGWCVRLGAWTRRSRGATALVRLFRHLTNRGQYADGCRSVQMARRSLVSGMAEGTLKGLARRNAALQRKTPNISTKTP